MQLNNHNKNCGKNLEDASKEMIYAANANLAIEFVLKVFYDGMRRFYYRHEKKRLLAGLIAFCTGDDMTKMQNDINKTDISKLCARG